jgi:hypothetical protein
MSWIVRDLWKTFELRREEYSGLLTENPLQAFEIINRIASQIAGRYGVFLQLNFPPGQRSLSVSEIGHRDLTMLVHRERREFQNVSEDEIKRAFKPLNPVSFDSAGFGYQGFRVRLSSGRIDCLPGGVHLWCEITPGVLSVLDWLFTNAYAMKRMID